MGVHTSEELEAKRLAVRDAIAQFVWKYVSGEFERNEPLLFHEIESLNSLITEYKRG